MRRLPLVMAVAVLSLAGPARAYGFMVRHEYTTCAQCHVDPSGGSVLTPYGRAQGELLLRTRYGKSTDEEPGRAANFLWGLVALPDEVLLGGDVRVAATGKPGVSPVRAFPMQVDAVGVVRSGKLVVDVSLGVGSTPTAPAKIVGEQVQLISRHHWVGVMLDEDQAFLIRVGRMPLPFGLRMPEHTSWVRALTRTDGNVSQQHGVSLAYSGTRLRGELMGIVGNLQLAPADFRERGYSGFLELALVPWVAIGISSLITHAQRDVFRPDFAVFRHAHGVFARVTPARPLVLSAEFDLTHLSHLTRGGQLGAVAVLQADLELIQGLHLVLMGEVAAPQLATRGLGLGAWGGAWWFFAPHADLRCDVIGRREVDGTSSVSVLAQVHVFL